MNYGGAFGGAMGPQKELTAWQMHTMRMYHDPNVMTSIPLGNPKTAGQRMRAIMKEAGRTWQHKPGYKPKPYIKKSERMRIRASKLAETKANKKLRREMKKAGLIKPWDMQTGKRGYGYEGGGYGGGYEGGYGGGYDY